MVRKANTLKSLDELKLSQKTQMLLEARFDSFDKAIKFARALDVEWDKDISPFWKKEFLLALKVAGFIRPREDFVMTFMIGRLYRDVFRDCKKKFVTSIDHLSNEQYESFVGLTEKEVRVVKFALRNHLTNREYEVVCDRYGLDGRAVRTYESINQHFRKTGERIDLIEACALNKLKARKVLPQLFNTLTLS